MIGGYGRGEEEKKRRRKEDLPCEG